jgi:glucose/sorbosone dehydrogenase
VICHKFRLVLFFALFGLLPLIVSAQKLQFDPIASGLDRPVTIANAGDGSGRLFIVQQTGQILIYDGTQVLPTPFLDISSKVECCGERGLLGLAFHPGYGSTSNYFYVYYTKINTYEITIARYTVTSDPNIVPSRKQASRLIRRSTTTPGLHSMERSSRSS